MPNLHDQKCVPCKEGAPPISREEAEKLLSEIPEWELVEDTSAGSGQAKLKIVRRYVLADFREALAFVNKVGEIAEAENHHPDILIVYKRVTLTLFTHEVGGLSMNDFILAAKINDIQP